MTTIVPAGIFLLSFLIQTTMHIVILGPDHRCLIDVPQLQPHEYNTKQTVESARYTTNPQDEHSYNSSDLVNFAKFLYDIRHQSRRYHGAQADTKYQNDESGILFELDEHSRNESTHTQDDWRVLSLAAVEVATETASKLGLVQGLSIFVVSDRSIKPEGDWTVSRSVLNDARRSFESNAMNRIHLESNLISPNCLQFTDLLNDMQNMRTQDLLNATRYLLKTRAIQPYQVFMEIQSKHSGRRRNTPTIMKLDRWKRSVTQESVAQENANCSTITGCCRLVDKIDSGAVQPGGFIIRPHEFIVGRCVGRCVDPRSLSELNNGDLAILDKLYLRRQFCSVASFDVVPVVYNMGIYIWEQNLKTGAKDCECIGKAYESTFQTLSGREAASP